MFLGQIKILVLNMKLFFKFQVFSGFQQNSGFLQNLAKSRFFYH